MSRKLFLGLFVAFSLLTSCTQTKYWYWYKGVTTESGGTYTSYSIYHIGDQVETAEGIIEITSEAKPLKPTN